MPHMDSAVALLVLVLIARLLRGRDRRADEPTSRRASDRSSDFPSSDGWRPLFNGKDLRAGNFAILVPRRSG